jgi:hypothetical protein
MNTAPDPAATFSGNLPSLPPEFHPASWPMPASTHEGLTELDPRFPIRLSQPAHIFWQLTAEWPDRETVIGQTIRATQQHTTTEERFVQPLHITAPIPVVPAAIAAPIYPELTPAARDDDWKTGTGTAILTVEEEPRSHRKHGPDGRFISRATS